MNAIRTVATATILLAGAALFAASFTAAMAAEPPGQAAASTDALPGPPPLDYFVRALALTKEQQSKLAPVLEAARDKARTDLQPAGAAGQQRPGPEQMRATVRMREADFRESLARILTPTQLTKYDQLQAAPNPEQPEVRYPHGHYEGTAPVSNAPASDAPASPGSPGSTPK